MIYQLPNGRVVHLTVEQYLDMTDADIDAMVKGNHGDFVNNPFYGSVIKKGEKKKKDEDDSIDYEPDLDEKDHFRGPPQESCEEDFPELPDTED